MDGILGEFQEPEFEFRDRGKVWSKETKFSSSQRGVRVIRVRVVQKKKNESDWKVGSNPREVGLSWTVSGEFALSEFELPESNCIYKWLTLSLILISIILKMDFWSKCRPQKNAAKFYRKITAYQALLICKWFNF